MNSLKDSYFYQNSQTDPDEIHRFAYKFQQIIHQILKKHLGQNTSILKSPILYHLNKLLTSKYLSDLYPNVIIALKIYLCTPASNCSAQRSFSALSRIKNYLQCTQTQQCMVHLAVLAIEDDLTVKLDYEDVIEKWKGGTEQHLPKTDDWRRRVRGERLRHRNETKKIQCFCSKASLLYISTPYDACL